MSALYFFNTLKNYTNLMSAGKSILRGYSIKSIMGDKITPFTANTLLGRMMVYLNNDLDKNNAGLLRTSNETINDLIHGNTSRLRSLNVDQISSLFYAANTNVLSYNKRNLEKVLNILDVECCLRLNSMNAKSTLKILNAFMHVVPNRITEYKFYKYTIQNIDACLESISKKDLLQFVFYLGLQKKSKKSQMVLRKCLKSINKNMLSNLTIEDICIICNSTYRTNTKITNIEFLNHVKQTLNDNLNLLKDPALLITLLKSIKQNNYEDDDLLSTISCTIFFNKTVHYYTFPVMAHILSLYANYCYYDEQLLDLFAQECIDKLRKCDNLKTKRVYLSEQLRAKDIAKFLWSVAILGYTKIDVNILEYVFVPKIKEHIRIGAYKSNPEQLLKSVLSLWILNCRSPELMSLALTSDNLAFFKDSQMKNKLTWNLLLQLVKYEDKSLLNRLKLEILVVPNSKRDAQLKQRPLLQRVFQILCGSSTAMKFEKFELLCQIPYLNIVGISGYNDKLNKAVNIEVVDSYTCVKNKDCQPSGFMRLKLRILEQLEVPLITIFHNEGNEMSDSELRSFLEVEIKLMC